MTQEHTITPPPELVEQWLENTRSQDCIGAYPANYEQLICTQAARWGADMELKACCEWLLDHGYDLCSPEMRKDRRSKPPSLAEQALAVLERTIVLLMPVTGPEKIKQFDTIRTALERLQALEQVSNGN